MKDGYTLQSLEERIGYRFSDIELLKQAMTHSSFTNEQKINKTDNYERLEFLGDAVLELVTSEFLFKELTDMPEGELTKRRASMVCEPSLAFCAGDLELGQFIRLGKGEENSGGRNRDSITSDVMEALIGAIYIDGGMDAAKSFITRFVLSDLENKILFYDSKTVLQETVQAETGPEHDKCFRVAVFLGKETLGEGRGRTKKAAEQQAAYKALLTLRERGYVFKKH